jgi:acyl-CoA thioesterase
MNEQETAINCANKMYAADHASQGVGIAVEVTEAGQASAVMTVTAEMINGFDVCHGGYIFMVADSAFAFACNGYDDLTFAAGAAVDFIRPANSGDTLHATATERYRGRQRGFYDVVVRNQHGQTVAIFSGRSHATGEPIL